MLKSRIHVLGCGHKVFQQSCKVTHIAWALNIPLGVDSQLLHELSKVNPMAQITEWVFGSICVGGGILTLGLIQKWGEIFPSWFPFIGGKRVPIMLAVVPASIIAIAVTAAGFLLKNIFSSLVYPYADLWGNYLEKPFIIEYIHKKGRFYEIVTFTSYS